MTVTCVIHDTVTSGNTLTLGSVDGTQVTAVTSASGAPTRQVNGADLTLGVQNVNNVGLTVSAFLTMAATVLEPSGSGNSVTLAQHPTNNALVLVTIAAFTLTLNATELRDAISNCLRTT
jgi:hypothetical protein